MKNCTQCNCPNDDNALFCRQCGAKLPDQTPYAVPVAPPPTGQPVQNNFTPQQPPYTAPVQPVINQPKKKGKGCLIGALVAVGVVVLLLFLIGIFATSDTSNTENDNKPAVTNDANDPEMQTTLPSVTVSSMVGGYSVTIKDSEVVKSDDSDILIVTYLFENHSDSSASFQLAIEDKAFQNGVEAQKEYFVWDHDFDSSSASKEIQPGISLEVQQAYCLNDPTSPVSIEISEAFSIFSDEKLSYTIILDK